MQPTHYLYLLVPPRPDFLRTITDAERDIMARHGAYLRAACDAGTLLLAGPTLDGAWGVGVLNLTSQTEAEAFRAADPVVSSGLMQAQLHPWMASISGLKA